jgi:protein involved in polysaccharide export with SLBB domain
MRRSVAAFVASAAVMSALPLSAFASPLRSGDHIEITIFNHPDMTVPQGTVDADGMVALPLVGNVHIAGLEPDAAAAQITTALKQYMRKPSVTVSVLSQNTTISIVGGPVSSLQYAPGQTLAGVVATEESSPGLDLHRVRLDRDGATLGIFDAQSLIHSGATGPALEPGDTIVFAMKPIGVSVVGAVKSPGVQYLDKGQTISDAVNAAGIGQLNAAVGAIDLLRDGQHTRLALSSTAAQQVAQDGDVISVPQAMLVSVGGMIAKPGPTPLTGGTTLVAAIYEAGGPLKYGDISHTQVLHDGTVQTFDVVRAFNGDASQNPHLNEGDVINVPESKHILLGDLFGSVGVIHLLW